MAYYPESIMPANLKSESADSDGNAFVIGASDHNRHDEEIRAIEKTLGIDGECSLVGALEDMADQLDLIRDGLVLTTSGIVAITDPDVPDADGLIAFPESWTTTLVTDMPDESTTDETVLPFISALALDDVEDMPDEGYITIINDVTLAPAAVAHTFKMSLFSPSIVNAKIGKAFTYYIIGSMPITKIDLGTNLPTGLAIQGNKISGTPTQAGIFTIPMTLTSPITAITEVLTIRIADSISPTITNSSEDISATAGSTLSFFVQFTGFPNAMSVTGLPTGVTSFGSQICGTPTTPGTYDLVATLTDEFGGSYVKNFTLTVS